MEEESKGISIGEIFKTIFLKKWLALIVALCITVVGILGIQLLYNRMKEVYTTEFSLRLPGYLNGEYYTFPDGTVMHYAEMVSLSELEAVKDSSADFEGIDIYDMAEKGNIEIKRNVYVDDAENSTASFTINVSKKYFKDYETGRKFLTTLISRPVAKYAQTEPNHYVYLDLSKNADTYGREISLLQSQLNYVLGRFESIQSTYTNNFVAGGRTIKSYVDELNSYKSKNTLNVLAGRVEREYILKHDDDSVKKEYELKKINLERELKVARETYEDIKNSGTAYLDGATVLKSQRDLIGNLEIQLDDVNEFLAKIYATHVDSEFETEYVEPEYKQLKEYTDMLEVVVKEMYSKTATVSYFNVNEVISDGGMGLVMSGVISLVLGVVVACVVAYVVGRLELKKRETAGDNTEIPVVSAEIQAAAAVTEDDTKEDKKD
ncbi:MAG: hypothetical protein K2K80_07165 [Clostridia bacterium]|nr:hypothetical protein [Clostridia bacterium]